ncbi:MAG: hypothetical protein RIC55_01750 [Pirellulaceae bacterium]
MQRTLLLTVVFVSMTGAVAAPFGFSQDLKPGVDKDLTNDLALLQGTWTIDHGNPPDTRSIKTIEGNRETLQRYDIKSGMLKGERSVEFALSKSGSLRVFTFYPAGGSLEEGASHVYKIEDETLIEVTGLLEDGDYRDSQPGFGVSRWKHVDDKDAARLSAQIAKDRATDLALLQGTWTMDHGNQGKGPPDTRSIKTIEGNRETVQRFDIATGELKSEHSIEFALSRSGSGRVFTFYPVGGSPEDGASYVYKIENNTLIEVSGLLHGDEYTNFQPRFGVWRWKRVDDKKSARHEEM